MGDMLSQDEINALLSGAATPADETADDASGTSSTEDIRNDFDENEINDSITGEQKDILGEVGNISMGTSATTLFALLGQKVTIDTPRVHVVEWKTLGTQYERPCVGVRVDYKEGLQGSNILVLKQHDVKIITNLMMGGDGNVTDGEEINEIDLSAIGEAMNQMVGSSATSLSSLIKMKIDIDTPKAFILDFTNDDFFATVGFLPEDIIVATSFRMKIGTLIDSEIIQVLPKDFALNVAEKLKNDILGANVKADEAAPQAAPSPQMAPQQMAPQQMAPQQMAPQQQYDMPPQQYGQPQMQYGQPQMQYGQPQMQYGQPQMQYAPPQQNVNVQPANFQSFDVGAVMQQKENIGIIMDVPLDVTVELGKTRKKIKEILEFSPGTVVELDKLAGEPIDILVNGKHVAKGEVVVIDENFGVRILDIISPENRI